MVFLVSLYLTAFCCCLFLDKLWNIFSFFLPWHISGRKWMDAIALKLFVKTYKLEELINILFGRQRVNPFPSVSLPREPLVNPLSGGVSIIWSFNAWPLQVVDIFWSSLKWLIPLLLPLMWSSQQTRSNSLHFHTQWAFLQLEISFTLPVLLIM